MYPMPVRTYLINRVDNGKFRLNGVQPSEILPEADELKKPFIDHVYLDASELPPKVDLRPDMTAVENQSKSACCVANALAGALEYLLRKSSGENIDISRLFIYYNARARGKQSDAILTDSGCTISSAIEALKESGTCLESMWPYDLKSLNLRPTPDAYEAAKNSRIKDALRVTINLDEMKACLAQGFPFIFGLRMYKSFDQATKTGFVPMPKLDDVNRTTHRTHSMLAVGYIDQSQVFIVRNSWGERWGDNGYCYIPYTYVADKQYCFAPWTVRLIETNDMGHEHWHQEDSTQPTYSQGDDDEDDDNRTIVDIDEEQEEVEEAYDYDEVPNSLTY